MSYHPDDTICAIATAPGGAMRGMVRISGHGAIDIVSKVFRSVDGAIIENVRLPTAIAGMVPISLHDRVHALPCDVFLWPTARSYTREPVAELHTLGSPPPLESLVAAICGAGARLAEPGEFTLRAFLAGRIDLTQAEAVLGVIDAGDNSELTNALSQLAGGLARPLQSLREDLLQLLAELEAGLDFVDEDIEFVSKETLLARLDCASRLLSDVARQTASRSTAATATQVALVGAPNAGKSSLFNSIVTRFGLGGDSTANPPSPAIVSPQRGTTRDYLTATIEIKGARCELLDTAGVDSVSFPPSEDRCEGMWQQESLNCGQSPTEKILEIERAAQSLAAERGAAAVIRVHCIDSSCASASASPPLAAIDLAESDIVVFTKSDLLPASAQPQGVGNTRAVITTSSRTGQGINALCERIHTLRSSPTVAQRGQAVASTAERCRDSVRLAGLAISRAREIIGSNFGDELAAAELRIALAELGKVVGIVYTDDLLDRIFSTFCIGK